MGGSSSRLEFLSSWNDPLKLIDRTVMKKDALSQNLDWAIHELMRWETCTTLIENLLYGEGEAASAGPSISAKQHEERMKTTMTFVQDVLAMKHTKLSQSVSATPPAMTQAAAAYSDEFQLAFTPSASKLFCAAAYSLVLATMNLEMEGESSMKSSMAAAGGGAGPTNSSTVAQPNFEAGPAKASAVEASDSPPSPSKPLKNLLQVSPSLSTYHPSSVSERIEIICKYVFISSFMMALTRACERNIKLYQHMQLYDDILKRLEKEKSKDRSAWSELQISGYKVERDRFHQVLDESLKTHDRWRLVLHYVYRDWELLLARHRLSDEMARWKFLRANCAEMTQSSAAAGGSEENEVQRKERALGGSSDQFTVNEVNQKLRLLEGQLSVIDSKMEGNERDSFCVGLAFLDVGLSGRIEIDETKDMPAWLFHLLDTKNRAAISYNDLRKVIAECTKRYESVAVKICEIRSQTEKFEQDRTRGTNAAEALQSTTAVTSISSASGLSSTHTSSQVLSNRQELERLGAELDEQRKNLMVIYDVFIGAFKTNVFPQITVDSLLDDQKKIEGCKQQLGHLVRNLSALAYLDPLHLMKSKLHGGDNHINNSVLNLCAEQMMRIAQKNESDLGKEERLLMHSSALAAASTELPIPISFMEGEYANESERMEESKGDTQDRQRSTSIEERSFQAQAKEASTLTESERAYEERSRKAKESQPSTLEAVPSASTD